MEPTPDPADIPEFDRVMRGLVGVDPNEVAEPSTDQEPQRPPPPVIVLFEHVHYEGARQAVFSSEALPVCPLRLDFPPRSAIVPMGISWSLFGSDDSGQIDLENHLSLFGPDHDCDAHCGDAHNKVWYSTLGIDEAHWLTNE
jgi:hypothetical protein